MADDDVSDMLKAWGLESYTDVFKEHGIDISCLALLTGDMLREIMPMIGDRAKFNANLEEWRKVIALANNQAPFTDCDLLNYLKSTTEGKALLATYDADGLLDNSGQRKICNLIVRREFQEDPEKSVKTQRLHFLAQEITKVFPKEHLSTYFIPYMNYGPSIKKAAKGKLLDCFNNKRREYKKAGLISSTNRSPSFENSSASLLLNQTTSETENVDEQIQWLNSSCDPWNLVQKYWEITRTKRLKDILSLNSKGAIQPSDYMKSFPALKNLSGYILTLTPSNLFENFPVYKDKILQLGQKISNTLKDPSLKCIIKDYLDLAALERGETSSLAAFIILPFLFFPVTTKRKKGIPAWGPSKIESRDGFITHIKSNSELIETITRRKQKYSQLDHNTEYKRIKYFTELGTYIPPREYVVGERLTETRKKTFSLVSVHCTAQFIPIRDVLKNFFQIKNLLSNTLDYMNECKLNEKILLNFLQGSVWKDKDKYHEYQTVVPIFLFFDDYEIGNPLGSHSGIHKLRAVYLSIPCLPPHQKSSLNTIFLALLFHSSDRQKFGNNVILFKPLIDELNYLRNTGIEIETDDLKVNLKFELGIIIGDNLGIHSITGFVESFSSNHPCRVCNIRKEELRKQCYADDNLLRTVEQYNIDVNEGDVSNSGVKEKCVWHDVIGFNVLDQVGVDIMHDILEGVGKQQLLLNNLFIKGNLGNTIEPGSSNNLISDTDIQNIKKFMVIDSLDSLISCSWISIKVVVFKCLKLNTIGFDEHFCSYEVIKLRINEVLIYHHMLYTHIPNNISVLSNGSTYVTLRSAI
ncbi:unnamed protein product [Macrosiphum euphorbiae]|uniref:SAM domain-containing protein n=1 Tax=Macrosiphum euphorbiae TaxID=13131 RepID=A0AAV0XIG8_9HEMI|nr:unnamed protein product [Macrosiphum euphorbiae]